MKAIPRAGSSVKSTPDTSRTLSERDLHTTMTAMMRAMPPGVPDVGGNGVLEAAILPNRNHPGAKRPEAEDGNPLPLHRDLLPPPRWAYLQFRRYRSPSASRRLLLRPIRISFPYRFRCFVRDSGLSTTASESGPSFRWKGTPQTGRPKSTLTFTGRRRFFSSMPR